MYEHRTTKFIFTVGENTDYDSECSIPFVVWPIDDVVINRLDKLSELAREENITVVTNEFMLYDGNDLQQPLFGSLSISGDTDPVLEMDMEKLVKDMCPVSIVTEETIKLSIIKLALGSPKFMNQPVTIVAVNCLTDLIIFDESDMRHGDLSEVVEIALKIFGEIQDGSLALSKFSEAAGIKTVYRSTHK